MQSILRVRRSFLVWHFQHFVPWGFMSSPCIDFFIHFFVSGKHPLIDAYMSYNISINPLLLRITNQVDFRNNIRHVYFWNFINEVINPGDIGLSNLFLGFLSWVIFLQSLARCSVLLQIKHLSLNFLAIPSLFISSFFFFCYGILPLIPWHLIFGH